MIRLFRWFREVARLYPTWAAELDDLHADEFAEWRNR